MNVARFTRICYQSENTLNFILTEEDNENIIFPDSPSLPDVTNKTSMSYILTLSKHVTVTGECTLWYVFKFFLLNLRSLWQ